MVGEAGRVGMNVGINSRPRPSKYRMLLIILPHGLGKEQVLFVCFVFLISWSDWTIGGRINWRWCKSVEGCRSYTHLSKCKPQCSVVFTCYVFKARWNFRMPKRVSRASLKTTIIHALLLFHLFQTCLTSNSVFMARYILLLVQFWGSIFFGQYLN